MARIFRQWIFIVLVFMETSVQVLDAQATTTNVQALTTDLFANYEKRIRPTISGGPTIVSMALAPQSILDLDETSQVLTLFGTMACSWTDDYLSWNVSDYSNIENFMWPQDDVWLPDMIIANSVENAARLGYKEMAVRIDHLGTVSWSPSMVIQTSCDLDVTYYPFDTQKCEIIIATKVSSNAEIMVTGAEGKMIVWEEYSEGGVWDLKDITLAVQSNTAGNIEMILTLHLKRLRTYYVVNIIMPVLFLSFTASLVFYLPADAGEKIGLSMTVLLAYAVYLTIIADRMPQTSLQVSLLAVYLTILLAVTALGVVASVFVLNIHHCSDDIPVGPRVTKLTRYVRQLLRMGYNNPNRVTPATLTTTDSKSADSLRASSVAKLHQIPPSATQHPTTDKKPVWSKESSFAQDELDEEEITWPKVAETLDRVFFISITCVVILVTIIILPYMATNA